MAGQLSHAIVDLLAGEKRPLHVAEIATRLRVDDKSALGDALDDLVYDGLVLQRAGRRYKISPDVRLEKRVESEGTLHMNPRGFGFVKTAGADDDIYVPADAVAGAMHGDKVRVRILARTRRGQEGDIVEVVARGHGRVVGTLQGRPGTPRRLEPDDTRIRGPIALTEDGDPALARAEAGLAVVAEITRYPEVPRENPQARLIKVLGMPGEPDVEVAKILAAHAVEEPHRPETIAEAEAYGDVCDRGELSRREDLDDIPFITIDPHDARDHDDAVWVERDDAGRYDAWVAIADVSHYVRSGTALDAEALVRGCSIYLPDRAVPMLPYALSGRLCSLLEGQERLCLCVQLSIDATGSVRRTRMIEGKMRSRAFLSYDSVARALGFTTAPARDPRAEALRHELSVMWDLATLRYKKRMRRGALDLDVPEVRIAVDADTRAPVAIAQRSGDPGVRKAYRIVEEMMLMANEAVASHMLERKLGAIYRVHAAPDAEKVERFAAAMDALGVAFDPDDAADPKALSKFLRTVEGHPKKSIIHNLLLRAMQQASYDVVNIGHYGLASPAYLHFTSPIRRYPDLVVHRLLRDAMRQDRRALAADGDEERLRAAAQLASQKERNAMEVEREVADLYRALYMKQHIGERFEASVSAVTPGGVWVQIADPFVAVLVSLDALGRETYEADDNGLSAVGSRSGDRVSLGDSMTVVIEDVSIVRRAVYGRRVDTPGDGARRSRKDDKRARREQAQAARRGRKQDKRNKQKGGRKRR